MVQESHTDKRLRDINGPEDLAWATSVQISSGIQNGHFKATEVLDSVKDRIDRENPKVNCIASTYWEPAYEQAANIDAQRAAGKDLPLLAGVPYFVKDITPAPNTLTTYGSIAYRDNVVNYEPVFMRRLAEAGAVFLGKATTSEWVCKAFTETDLYGITRNPWNTDRTCGGSSGGSGVAVASGFAPFAEGSDMGGSIRSPATYCGVVGLKPSFGRIPWDIMPTQFETMIHFGPLAATVDDAAMFMDVTSGPSNQDIMSLPAPDYKLIDTGQDIRGLKLAYCMDLGYYYIEPGVRKNMERAIETLRDMGATVEEVEINWSRDIEDLWYDNWAVYLAAFFGDELSAKGDTVASVVHELIKRGREIDAVSFKRIELLRTKVWHDMAAIFEKYDALCTPATSRTAPPVGGDDEDLLQYGPDGKLRGGALHLHFNFVSQCPAISVPMGLGPDDGMPTSIQFIGRRYDEPTIFKLARAIESSPYAGTRRPPL